MSDWLCQMLQEVVVGSISVNNFNNYSHFMRILLEITS